MEKTNRLKNELGNIVKHLLKEPKVGGIIHTICYSGSYLCWVLYHRRQNMMENHHPAAVQKNKLVFESYGDYGDNARALCEYMLERGYADHYEFVWLVDRPRELRKTVPPEVRLVRRKYANRKPTVEALRELHSAKYVFYTVSLNWGGWVQKDQTYVDLWHGCSFKDNKGDRKVFFDIVLVTSPFFVPLKQKFWKCPEEKILPIGYPRYDQLKNGSERTADFVRELLRERNCEKMVIWMPTFRKSNSDRLNEDTLDKAGKFNLPIVQTMDDFERLNQICRENRILFVLKKHRLHRLKAVNTRGFENIEYIDDDWLQSRDIQLYHLLHETDALITDYSSIGIDYLLLDRPIGFTLDDYLAYQESRGFTIENPIEYMPGNHIYNMDEFAEFIRQTAEGRDDHRAEREKVTEKLHVSCDNYCQALLDRLNIMGKQ